MNRLGEANRTTSDSIQRAAEQGIPEPAVRAIVERRGGQGIARDDLIPWLDQWIEAAVEALGRHPNEGAAFQAAYQEAERRFRAGRLDASAALMDELAREEQQEAERQQERQRYHIRLLEEAIRFDELQLNAPAAAEKLRRIAATQGITEPDARGRWLHDKALEYAERGREKGINAALTVAIHTYRATLEEYTSSRMPRDRSMTQNNLGLAFAMLGSRESGTAHLEEAVTAYHAALEERTRDRVPLNWANTLGSQGVALMHLADRSNDPALAATALAQLEQAHQTLRDAGHAPWAAYYEAQIPQARAILPRLTT